MKLFNSILGTGGSQLVGISDIIRKVRINSYMYMFVFVILSK